MLGNVGKKLKILSLIMFVFAMVPVLCFGIMFLFNESVGLGLVVIVAGIFSVGLISMLLYGFGEIVDKICHIDRFISQTHYDKELDLLKDKLHRGIISEDAYQSERVKLISKLGD